MSPESKYEDKIQLHTSVEKEGQQNPILQKLDLWLVKNAVPGDRAKTAITQLRDFYSNHISQRLPCPTDLGVTAKKSEQGGVTVWLCVLWPKQLNLNEIENNQLANGLIKTFADEVEIPLLPNPSVHLEYFLPGHNAPRSFKTKLCSLRSEGREFIGIFSVPTPHAPQPSPLSTRSK